MKHTDYTGGKLWSWNKIYTHTHTHIYIYKTYVNALLDLDQVELIIEKGGMLVDESTYQSGQRWYSLNSEQLRN